MKDSRCVIIGDLNVNVLNYISDNNVRNYVDMFSEYGFYNEINIPTYHSPITQSDVSCLDHIFHNLNHSCRSFVVEPRLADHYGVCLLIDNQTAVPNRIIKFRDYSEQNIDKFNSNFVQDLDSFLPPTDEIESYAQYLHI